MAERPDFANGSGTEPAKLGDALQHAFTVVENALQKDLRTRSRMFFRRARVAPRSQELVFLDADDDLGTIRSKLESSSAEEIYLVIPRRSSVMRTPLEFRILARIANEMSSETVLVTG